MNQHGLPKDVLLKDHESQLLLLLCVRYLIGYFLHWFSVFNVNFLSHQSRNHKPTPRPLNRNLSIFNYFDKDCIPVNDLIDFVATVGGNIVSSSKSMQPPQLFSKNRALTNVYNLSQKRKRGAKQEPESVVDNYIKNAIQCSQTVFERLHTQANKVTKGRSADFIPKNPFLYPWEHDKDRMNGGQWRERREQFLVFLPFNLL